MRSSRIREIRLGTKDLDQLLFIVINAALHDLHTWSKKTFEGLNVQD